MSIIWKTHRHIFISILVVTVSNNIAKTAMGTIYSSDSSLFYATSRKNYFIISSVTFKVYFICYRPIEHYVKSVSLKI